MTKIKDFRGGRVNYQSAIIDPRGIRKGWNRCTFRFVSKSLLLSCFFKGVRPGNMLVVLLISSSRKKETGIKT